MSTVLLPATQGPTADYVPELRAGDRLTRAEFERRYAAMPHIKKAELIEGVVYMPSPVTQEDHGGPHFNVIGWLAVYRAGTPGVEGGDNSTLRWTWITNRNRMRSCAFFRPSAGNRGTAGNMSRGAGADRRGGRQQRQLRLARQAARLSPQ